MSEILKKLYNACNPSRPASRDQYVDSEKARASRDLTRQVRSDLANLEGDFVCFLFSGHNGCGKSTELRHLADKLRTPAQDRGEKRYLPIIVDVAEYLDEYDVTPTDVLLAIVARVASELDKNGVRLRDSFFKTRLSELKETLLSGVNLSEAEVPLGLLTLNFKLLRGDPTNRNRVRKALDPHTSSLREEIKTQFEKARGKLHEKGEYDDLVVIIDNLEKVQRIQGFAEGFASHKELFVERAPQLTGLGAHTVYTVPLPLVLSHGAVLQSRYGSTPFVLPMIKVEERGTHNLHPDGHNSLKDLIQKRLGREVRFESFIEEKAFGFLARYSGGNTRQFMVFIRQAITLIDKEPITLSAAQRSVSDTVAMYSRMPSRFWLILAALELSEDQSIDTADDDTKLMLEQLMILEYRNGGTEDDSFNPSAPWYAVHPIIRELKRFKRVVKELWEERKKKSAIRYGKE